MKKFFYISIGIIILLIGAVIILGLNDISVEVENQADVETSFDNDETFLLVLGSSDCHYCKSYKKGTLVQYLKEPQIPLHFLYTDQSFPNETELGNFLNRYQIDYQNSPSSYFVKNGQVVAKKEGDINLAVLNQFIDENR